jgi:hypothetical protein
MYFRVLDNIINTGYHSRLELYARLSELENSHPNIAEFRAGDALSTSIFHQLKMTDQVNIISNILYSINVCLHTHMNVRI